MSVALVPINSENARDAYQVSCSAVILGHREAMSFFEELDALLARYGVGYPVLQHNLPFAYGLISAELKSTIGTRREVIFQQFQRDLAEAVAALLGGDAVEFVGPEADRLEQVATDIAARRAHKAEMSGEN